MHRFATSESTFTPDSIPNSVQSPSLPSLLSSFSGYTVTRAKVPPLFPKASEPGDKQTTPLTSFTNRIFSVATIIKSGTSLIDRLGSFPASRGIDSDGYNGYKLRCSSSCEQNSRCLSTFFSCLHRIAPPRTLPIAAFHQVHQHVAVRHADPHALHRQHARIARTARNCRVVVRRLRKRGERERVVDRGDENRGDLGTAQLLPERRDEGSG